MPIAFLRYDGILPALSGSTWGDRVVIDFISAVLEQYAQTNFLVGVMQHAQELKQRQKKQEDASYDTNLASSIIMVHPKEAIPTNEKDINQSSKNQRDESVEGSMKAPFASKEQHSSRTHNHSETFIAPGPFARICSTADIIIPTDITKPLQQRTPSYRALTQNLSSGTNLDKRGDDDASPLYPTSSPDCDSDSLDSLGKEPVAYSPKIFSTPQKEFSSVEKKEYSENSSDALEF